MTIFTRGTKQEVLTWWFIRQPEHEHCKTALFHQQRHSQSDYRNIKKKKMWTNVYSPDWYQNLTVKTSTTSLVLPWKCAPGLGRASLAKNWIPAPTQPPAHEGQEATCPLIDTCWPESPSADPVVMMLNHSPGSEREWFVNLKRSRNCQRTRSKALCTMTGTASRSRRVARMRCTRPCSVSAPFFVGVWVPLCNPDSLSFPKLAHLVEVHWLCKTFLQLRYDISRMCKYM